MTSTPTSRRGCAGRRTIGSWTDLSRLALRMNGSSSSRQTTTGEFWGVSVCRTASYSLSCGIECDRLHFSSSTRADRHGDTRVGLHVARDRTCTDDSTVCDIDLEADELGRDLGETLVASLCPAI